MAYNDPELRKLYQDAYGRENYHRWYIENPTANAERNKRDRAKIRQEILDLYGRKCNWPDCTWLDDRILQLDHIKANPDKTRGTSLWYRGGVGLYRAILRGEYPKEDFQLLCPNHNTLKKLLNREFKEGNFKWLNSED